MTRLTGRILLASVLFLLAPACSSTNDPPPVEEEEGDPTLRSQAEKVGLDVGAAIGTNLQNSDPTFATVLRREFSMVTAENCMKPAHMRPAQDTYDFACGDALVAFAAANGQKVHGHTLIWHESIPSWMGSDSWSREQLLAILHDHITTVVTHFKGQVAMWDVVNEAVEWDGSLRQSFFLEKIGPEYLELAFQWAHEADPDVKLYYNDYGAEGLGTKSNGVYNLVRDLKDAGVPIHGVGMQMHVTADSPPSTTDVATNMARFASLGIEVQITEMDVRIEIPPTDNAIIRQAQVYRNMMDVCLAAPNCNALITWGLTDRHSWVPSFFNGYGAALLFDEDYQPKLAYQVMLDGLTEASQ